MNDDRNRPGRRRDNAAFDRAPSQRPARRSQELDFSGLVGPRRNVGTPQEETLQEFAARYRKINDALDVKYPDPSGLQPIEIGNCTIQCSVCSISGPSATTWHAATRLAQEQGFVHLRDQEGKPLRGGPHNNLIWVCRQHAEDDRRASAEAANPFKR